jgi:hypothetical protein
VISGSGKVVWAKSTSTSTVVYLAAEMNGQSGTRDMGRRRARQLDNFGQKIDNFGRPTPYLLSGSPSLPAVPVRLGRYPRTSVEYRRILSNSSKTLPFHCPLLGIKPIS